MMKFGSKPVSKPKGKPGQQEMLPSRHAMSELVAHPLQTSLNDYAKRTPSGAGAPMSYPAIIAEGEEGASVMP